MDSAVSSLNKPTRYSLCKKNSMISPSYPSFSAKSNSYKNQDRYCGIIFTCKISSTTSINSSIISIRRPDDPAISWSPSPATRASTILMVHVSSDPHKAFQVGQWILSDNHVHLGKKQEACIFNIEWERVRGCKYFLIIHDLTLNQI